MLDLGAQLGIVQKSGAWFSYGDIRLGQGRENSRVFLIENPDISGEIESRLRAELNLPATKNVETPELVHSKEKVAEKRAS